jgi:hypothetical protein
MPLAYIKLIDRLNTSTPDIGDPLPKEAGQFVPLQPLLRRDLRLRLFPLRLFRGRLGAP